LEHHDWASLDGNTSLFIDNITSSHLYIGIHSFQQDAIISWEATDQQPESYQNMDIEDKEGKVQCKNCHAWVLDRTHEGFCLLNNILCSWGCGEVFKKGSEELVNHWHCDQCDYIGSIEQRERHMAYCHTLKTCACTQFTTDSYQLLAEHKRTNCPEKLITCRYCHVSNLHLLGYLEKN
jgi:hypothetical protein